MDETKVTATLPHLTMEIIRREDPAGNAEFLAIQVKATPSFDALARLLAPPGLAPMALMWANPVALWMQMGARMMQAAWSPWLAAAREPPRLKK